jgi:hypothetical protein
MGPQNVTPRFHLLAKDGEIELVLAATAPAQVSFKHLEALVDLTVLVDQIASARVELGHAPGQHGEEVALLDGVMRGEMMAELQPFVEKLLERQVAGAVAVDAGRPEERPGLPEVVMLGEGRKRVSWDG